MRWLGPAGAAAVIVAAVLWTMRPPAVLDADDMAFSSPPPDEGPLRIVALGTSLTARAEWPSRLADKLGTCGLTNVTVEKVARAGANSADGVDLAEEAAGHRPHLVIVEFAVNDADLLDGVSRDESRAALAKIISTLRGETPEPAIVLMTTNPVRGLRGLMRPRLMERYGDYPDVAREFGTGFFNGTVRWSEPQIAAISDGLHPDPMVEATLYADDLARLIPAGFGKTCRD